MQTFSIQDLAQKATELVRDAEAGQLSLVTDHGRPLFLTMPISQRLLEAGIFEALAVQLYAIGTLSLSKAALLADVPIERFVSLLAAAGVDVVSYPPEELDDELAAFAG